MVGSIGRDPMHIPKVTRLRLPRDYPFALPTIADSILFIALFLFVAFFFILFLIPPPPSRLLLTLLVRLNAVSEIL